MNPPLPSPFFFTAKLATLHPSSYEELISSSG